MRGLILAGVVLGWIVARPAAGPERVIEILADKDSSYRMAGQAHPELRLKAGETVTLRITARKAKTGNRDGSVHGFALLRAKDRLPVAGWNLFLKPGTEDFHLTAPTEPGEYVVVCTVICSEHHEQMHMKVTVTAAD